MSIYGVCDGHGRKGHHVSNFATEHFPKIMLENEMRLETEPQELLIEAFESVQQLLSDATQREELDAAMSGTTATVVVHDHAQRKLWVAHAGDSGCCLRRRASSEGLTEAVPLTMDHTPELEGERARIEEAGGRVDFDGRSHRVYAANAHYPGLNMSRALGILKGQSDAGIIAEPTVTEVSLAEEDESLIICSDGVWQHIEPSEAAEILARYPPTAAQAVEALAAEARTRWLEEDEGLVDDITALVIDLDVQSG
jgi:serine/threonine protein phosphatase PrpC